MDNAGETLAETLVAMLILALAALILAGAICSAARVNFKTERMLAQPAAFGEPELSNSFVQLQSKDGTTLAEIPVTVTEQHNGDFYYE